jgi:hypothetical protein
MNRSDEDPKEVIGDVGLVVGGGRGFRLKTSRARSSMRAANPVPSDADEG